MVGFLEAQEEAERAYRLSQRGDGRP